MAMVLGAAQLLTQRRDFNGTVRFIFQPAKELGRGAAAMIDAGLLERFPVNEIYGAHNMPGMPAGHIATRVGSLMASEDNFVIRVTGVAGMRRDRTWAWTRWSSAPALENGAGPVQKVAIECGFGDVERMRRSFMRLLGVPPSSLRRCVPADA